VLAQLLEPPCTDPYARWCGRGGAARLPPIPIFDLWPIAAQSVQCGMSATGESRHAGRREVVRFCRVGPGNFTLSPSQIPYVNLSIHTARVTARRLPPSAEPSGSSRFYPVGPSSTTMTCPLRSTSITLASTLLRGSPPLSGASVLSASRLEPLAPFPLASPARFSRSIQVAHRHYRPAANETALDLRRAVGAEVVHWLWCA